MKLVIVGGVAGGATAAARARRLSEDADIILFERGEHVSFANCGLPYHIGGEIEEREDLLLQTPEGFWKRYRVEVRVRTEVRAIHPDRKEVEVADLAGGREYTERYDKLILSPGAAPIRPPLPGIDDPRVLSLRDMADMDRILSRVPGARRALVVGAGYIGLEMAECLMHRGLTVQVAEMLPQVLPPFDPEMVHPVRAELEERGVEIFLKNPVVGFSAFPEAVTARLEDGRETEADLVLFAVGVRPEVDLAKRAGLTLGESGGIRVDERMCTSDPDVFAVGDAAEVKDFVTGRPARIPLAGPANRQARIAADNCMGREATFRGTQGTAIVRVFSLTAAMTGASEKTLRRYGIPYHRIYLHPNDHASYFPGAEPISLKVLFDPGSGRLLGAQAVGKRGVDKRIDVLALAIQAGMTVYDLEEAELAYAPPYGSAKDPVNMAGFVGSNLLRSDVDLVQADEIPPEALPVDVRGQDELEQEGALPGAVHIPLPDLRRRMEELPSDRPLLLYCAVGIRSYIAYRILRQKGYRCQTLAGGHKTFLAFQGARPSTASD